MFLPGLELCKRFYWEAVRPVLARRFPHLKHAAALMDGGSEVLGFDDALSTDHHWGPRLQLFVAEEDWGMAEAIKASLAHELPYEFLGYPTNFSAPDPNDNGVQLLEAIASGPVNHRVVVQTARRFVLAHLGFDLAQPLEAADWLTFAEQRLRTMRSGAVYHDEVGLQAVRERFAYYPRDVWLYLLAAGWTRIGQEEHLMGRAGMVGDEVGSALIGARLARDVMRLGFLMEKTYAPYPKWFGTAFKQLDCAAELLPRLQAALHAASWQEREAQLVQAYERLAARHNALRLTEPMPEQAISFFGRPFQVMALHGFAEALCRQIEDEAVKQIAARPLIGSLDLWSDSTDLVSNPAWRRQIRAFYELDAPIG